MRTFGIDLSHVVPVAGLYGNRIEPIVYRRGHRASGDPIRCIRCPDVDQPLTDQPDELTSPDVCRTAIEDALAGYAASGDFTIPELRTLKAIWLEHRSLADIARGDGVSPQAVRSRIEGRKCRGGKRHGGILKKAAEFASDWQVIKHAQRRW